MDTKAKNFLFTVFVAIIVYVVFVNSYRAYAPSDYTTPTSHKPNIIQDFGGIGNGVFDDAPAFNAASGRGTVILPWTPNGYYLNSSVILKSNTYFTAIGGMAKIVMGQSFSSGILFNSVTNSGIGLFNLEISGESNQLFNAVGGAGTRAGVYLYAHGNNKIRDCYIHGFDNYGVTVQGLISSAITQVLTNNNGFIAGTDIDRCYYGALFQDSATEYCSMSDTSIRECRFGLQGNSGNLTFVNCRINYNGTGFYLSGGINNGHGNFMGGQINHNTIGFWTQNIVVGFSFNGTMLFSGANIIDNCKGVQVRGCVFDFDSLTFQNGGSGNVFEGNWCRNTVANTLVNPANAGRVQNNQKDGGGWFGAAGLTSTMSITNSLMEGGLEITNADLIVSGVAGTFRVGPPVSARAILTNVITATATLDFPSTLIQTNADLNIAVTGARSGDEAEVIAPAASVTVNGFYRAWATTDVVTVRFINDGPAGGLARDPASGTFRAIVRQYR